MARRDQDVVPAVQVRVHDERAPCPVGGGEPEFPRRLGEGPVAAVQLHRIPVQLHSRVRDPGRLRGGLVTRRLDEALRRVPGEHVGREEVEVSVAVEISDVDGHRGEARRADGLVRDGREGPVALVEPDPVLAVEVVRNIEVRVAVLVPVAEAGRESPVPSRHRDVPAGTREGRAGGRGRESSVPESGVEFVRLSELEAAHEAAIEQLHAVVLRVQFAEFGRNEGPTVLAPPDVIDVQHIGRMEVVHLPRLVVRDVEVEITIAVGVGQRRGRAPPRPGETRVLEFREAARAVAEEDPVPAPVDRDHEIEVIISVQVDERRPSREHAFEREGGGRDLLEAPTAEVAVEGARAPEAGEEDVGQTIAVHIPDRHALPLGEHAVVEARRLVDVVEEGHAAPRRVERTEASGAARLQLPPPVSVRLDPGAGLRRPAGRGEQGRREEGPCVQPPSPLGEAPLADAPWPSPITRSNSS